MTEFGVRVFTLGTIIFGAAWGWLAVGTLVGILANAAVAGVVGWLMWSSMRIQEMPGVDDRTGPEVYDDAEDQPASPLAEPWNEGERNG